MEEQLQQYKPCEPFRQGKDRLTKDHELYCSPCFVISQRDHSTGKLKQRSFLLSSARLPAPMDLLHKCLCSPMRLCIFIGSALEEVPYYSIVSQIAQTFEVKSTLYLHLRFECWNGAKIIEMTTSPTTFHWICGQWISISKFSVQLSCCMLNSYCLLRWKSKLGIPEWEQKNASFFPSLLIFFSLFRLNRHYLLKGLL